MKNIFYLSVIFLLYTHHAFSACEIVSYPKIVKLNKRLDSSIVKESNCSSEVQESFIDFLSSSSGELNSKHLSHIFRTEYNVDITLKPNNISVRTITEELTTLLNLGEDTIIGKVTNLHSQASIQIKKGDLVSAVCNNCESAGQKNIKLYVNKDSIWLAGQIYLKRTGFVINDELNPFKDKLSSHHFTKKTFYDDGRSHLFQDIDNIQFYKTNKKLERGKALKTSDLSPITLIKPGQKIKVILKGKSISLKSSAYSRSLGKYGDFIEVFNTKTNKKVTAQVIDFNTVMVQL